MQPTQYEDVNRIAAELVVRITDALGSNLGGVYLFGSATIGAFERGISDIDLLVATREPMSEQQFAALEAMHRELARDHPAWDDRVEALYVSAADLRAVRTAAPRVAAISPGEPFHWREAEPGRLMNWYDAQENGIPLSGPPARTFIEPISASEFVDSVRNDLEQWPGWLVELSPRTGAQSYTVLTICRALYACRTGKQLSKTQAGVWAQDEMPEWSGLVSAALEWRRSGSGPAQPEVDVATRLRISEFVEYARRSVSGS